MSKISMQLIYEDVLKKYEDKNHKYLFLTDAEQAILALWRENCYQGDNLWKETMSLKWYQIIKEITMLEKCKVNAEQWQVLFKKLVDLKIFDKIRDNHA